MKLTKKKVFVLALAICLVALISAGSLAWFSAQDEVTNEFFIADSTDTDPEDIFSVDVWENTPEGDEDQDGADYKEILPGDKLKKEVRVENTGHYAQYVRVIVTVSDAQAWIDALGSNYNAADLFDGFDATKWAHVSNNLYGAAVVPTDLVYTLYYKDVVESGDVIELFNNIKIPTSLTKEQAAAFVGGFSVNVKAQAVQTENVVPDGTAAEDAAFEAFKAVEADQPF